MAGLVRPMVPPSVKPPGIPRPRPSTVAWVLVGVLALLTADAFVRERGSLDYRLMRAVAGISFPGDHALWTFFSELTGSFWAITLWTALLCALLVSRRWLAATALMAFPVVGGINSLIRMAVGRPRPDIEQFAPPWLAPGQAGAGNVNDYVSYPSGHVVGAVLLYGFLFILAGHLANRPSRVGARTACVVVIVCAGISRVWLGAHWTGDVLAGYALGGLALLGVAVAYRTLEPTMRDVPLIRAGFVPHDDARPHAHALTSTILFRGDEVSKVYNPGFVPRMVYWFAFQAPFAYAHNPVALQAAVARRNLAGKLTEYWFGRNCVAEALRVETIDGRWAITGRFTDGVEPRDHHRARQFLFDLADRFDAAGLPTWQIDPRQPRSLGNVLEGADGSYTVIDLESGLVSPLASPRAWMRAIRRAMVPIYDDVYFDLTKSYIEAEAPEMAAKLGEAWTADLQRLAAEAEQLANAWHRSEPRVWSRSLRFVYSGFGAGPAVSSLRRRAARGRERAEEWLEASVAAWKAEGRIDDETERRLREEAQAPEFQAVLPHFGVHLMVGVALRFPFGSITRASYSLGNLALAAARFATRRSTPEQWRLARRVHSPLVIFVAAMPAIGTFAYMASPAVRSNHLLARVVLDSAGQKMPFQLYRRTGLRRLVAGRQREATS